MISPFKKPTPYGMGLLLGGAGGIRTHGRDKPSNDFESFSL